MKKPMATKIREESPIVGFVGAMLFLALLITGWSLVAAVGAI